MKGKQRRKKAKRNKGALASMELSSNEGCAERSLLRPGFWKLVRCHHIQYIWCLSI
ncbi:hypothetical protein GE21DRAFT_1289841 [Neurospora crassa]|nr:hypothetical protein GE21DRAFT_1289841 [Neurospora crassa]